MASMRHRLLGAPWTGTFSITNADGASANKILSVLSSGAYTIAAGVFGRRGIPGTSSIRTYPIWAIRPSVCSSSGARSGGSGMLWVYEPIGQL